LIGVKTLLSTSPIPSLKAVTVFFPMLSIADIALLNIIITLFTKESDRDTDSTKF